MNEWQTDLHSNLMKLVQDESKTFYFYFSDQVYNGENFRIFNYRMAC